MLMVICPWHQALAAAERGLAAGGRVLVLGWVPAVGQDRGEAAALAMGQGAAVMASPPAP